MPPTPHRAFRSTHRSLATAGFPMRLWNKAKEHGVWDPRAIDFSRDADDWRRLDDGQREVLLHLTTLFQAGEESVTLDLLPLIQVIAEEGRLEEEMYLTSFLWEEAKHVELFRRFLDEVAGGPGDLSRFFSDSYHTIFGEELPTALGRLRHDPSPVAQAEASVTYNMIVEGVLAETGYHAYGEMLKRNGLMPGMQRAVDLLRRDESRHMAYGVYLLSRLVAEHGDPVWEAIEGRLGELLAPAVGIIHEIFARYDEMPFGLELDAFVEFAMGQFGKRSARIERARNQSLAEIEAMGAVEA
ncbi:MAG: R2-like ligand-binding oxidase [Acidobacteria bacterium]|nr:R2-like ligand-binding oxidase [Acidobacteriota bacterium]